jgi:transcriptional regulator with GAF, ATPase, and Fis domain/pSer/pThr/pTyr-binding forkhead associated (FHA) protein
MKLTILEDGTRSELQFDKDVLTIGRAIDNEIRLSHTLVSRHHCRIEGGDEAPWLIDLGSSNGTSVNGERVMRRLLEDGDQLQIGKVRVQVHLERPEQELPQPDETQPIEVQRQADLGDDGLRTLTGEARRERDNLRVFARITAELARQTDLMPLLRQIVDSAVALVGGERGFLLMGEKVPMGERLPVESEEPAPDAPLVITDLAVRVARSFDRSDIAIPRSRLSMGIASRVLEKGAPVLAVDAAQDDRFSGMASVEDLRLRSVMCLPIRIEDRVLGVLYVDNRLQHNAFSEADLELVELFAAQAAVAILNARRVAELRSHNQRLEQSRRQIQQLNEQLGRKVRDRDTELAVVRAELGRERGRYDYTAIVGASDGMREVFHQLDKIIEADLPVMIHGESGTGKELIARAIHFNGARRDRPFISENCAALPDTLLESELFGHARGAFTGAHRAKKGLLEQADGGTLFLDEVGDMSTSMQKKLLRALQEGEFRPLGMDRKVKVNVRLLTASHRDLEELVRSGEFREDLFYRINVLAVHLPALRERREDIPLLAEHLLVRASREAGKPAPLLPHDVMAALVAHDWPGNVRELENEMRRLIVMAQDEVTLEHLSPAVRERRSAGSPEQARALAENPGDIRAAVAELEMRSIEAALAQAGGNKSKAAASLGISRFALQRKLDKYDLGGSRESAEGEDAVVGAPDGDS